jgi:hypothetical protein
MSSRGWASAAALLLGAASSAGAQQQGFFLTSPLSVGGSHESKFIVDNRELSDEVVLVAPPTVSFLRLSPRGELSISYQPEFQAFTTHHELNAVDHVGELAFSRATSPNVTFSFGDTFISTADPSRRVVDSVILLPRDRFTQNSGYVELTRRFGMNTTLSFHVDGTLTRVRVPQASRTGLVDRLGSAANVNFSHHLGRRHILSWTYMFLDSRPLGDAAQPHVDAASGIVIPAPEPDQAHSGAATYLYQGDDTSLRLAGGVIAGRVFTYTGGAQLERYIGRRSVVTITAQRNLSYFGAVAPGDAAVLVLEPSMEGQAASVAVPGVGSGVAPMGIYESLVGRFKLDLTRSLTATASGVVQRSVSDLTGLTVRSDFARLRLDWQLARALAVYGSGEMYRQSFNEFVGVPMNWQRYGVGFEITVSGKPNPLAERRRERIERERKARRGEEPDDEQGAPARHQPPVAASAPGDELPTTTRNP